MAYYTSSAAMDTNAGAEPGFALTTEVSEDPTSFAPPARYTNPQHMQPHDEPASVQAYRQIPDGYDFIAQPDPSVEGHVVQVPFELEPPTLQVPGHLHDLCAKYVASYNYDATPRSSHMESAQTLAVALLQHYYPESDGYIVQPSPLGPVAKHGLNFTLKTAGGSNPDFNALPPKKDPKKGRNKKPAKAQQKAEYLRQFDHLYAFTASVKWHMIEPEDIAGFVVLKKITVSDGEDEYHPYTYLAIMIDNLQTSSFFSETNDVHRGDILTDVLCRGQHIRTGHGILLFGTRFEFYDFHNGASTVFDTDASISVEEPWVSLCKDTNNMDLVVDMGTTGLQAVDRMFREVAAKGVEYLDKGVDADASVEAEAESTGKGEVDAEVEQKEEVTMSDVVGQHEAAI